jgi:hypothetical protein
MYFQFWYLEVQNPGDAGSLETLFSTPPFYSKIDDFIMKNDNVHSQDMETPYFNAKVNVYPHGTSRGQILKKSGPQFHEKSIGNFASLFIQFLYR